MWPFTKIKEQNERIEKLEKFNDFLLESNKNLFELYRRIKFPDDGHAQDCVKKACDVLGVRYDHIKTPEEYYIWVWTTLVALGLLKK